MSKAKSIVSKNIKVLFASFEAAPFYKSGGLGDVAGSLPQYLKAPGCTARVILPKLDVIPKQYVEKMEYICSFNVSLGWRNQYCGLFRLKHNGATYFFLDNEYYFKRGRGYGEFDDGERMAFFSKAVCEAMLYLPDFQPNILHCNDWHVALAPIFLREHYKDIEWMKEIKTIFTIHNLKFQGWYSESLLGDVIGLDNTPAASALKFGDAVNFLKGAILYCDKITTVSPSYAEEICTPYYGEFMDGIFNFRKADLSGILNGIDYKIFDPETDPALEYHFSAEDVKNKKENKLALQRELHLEENADIPMFAIISRLTEQKGMDLVAYALPEMMNKKLQLVVLGTGDAEYEALFKNYAHHCPEKLAACIKFDEALSHKIYASSDVFLMPSRFEPCGLSQMMSMRYGTLPLVRETGGLKDSVAPYNKFEGTGTGFGFKNYNGDEMLGTIDEVLDLYFNDKKTWESLQKQAMTTDLSWKAAASQYRRLYKDLLQE